LIELSPEQLQTLFAFIAIGFFAQLIDGALGMAFGVITNTLLVGVMGVAPARASAQVHLVECFTTAASAISHLWQRNIDWRLFALLAIPGTIGGVLGAYLLTQLHADAAKPWVMGYLACVGIYLLWRSWRIAHGATVKTPRLVAPLGFVGGFLDAAGGGGWGSVVTSNLLVQGADPRYTIGTVNSVEFVLTLVVSATFISVLGVSAFTVAAVGLIIGGLVAAPIGAILVRRINVRWLLALVGLVLTTTSIYSLFRLI
jgi:uncharacterized protein